MIGQWKSTRKAVTPRAVEKHKEGRHAKGSGKAPRHLVGGDDVVRVLGVCVDRVLRKGEAAEHAVGDRGGGGRRLGMARQAARVVDGGQRRRDGDGARKIDSAMAVAARTAGHTGHWGIWGRGGACWALEEG